MTTHHSPIPASIFACLLALSFAPRALGQSQVEFDAYLKASNTGSGDRFANSVAIAGDTLVVGAHLEGSAATGVNGDQANNAAEASGAAYVFVRSGSTWSQEAYLKASNTDASDQFAGSVAISGDTIVVGASREDSSATGVGGDQANDDAMDSGAVYVFVRSGSSWTQEAYLKASNTEAGDLFGGAVAISGDTLVVGAIQEDSASTGVGGDQADGGAEGSGAVYVFVRNGTTWSQEAYLKSSNTDPFDQFGGAVDVFGDTVVAGASSEDSQAAGVGGNQLNNSAVSAGAAYVFVRSGTSWSQEAYLKPSNTDATDAFGRSVAIFGDRLVVGAPGEAGGGTGVNPGNMANSTSSSGAAYVFVRSGTSWSQEAYLKASNTQAFDSFGTSVALADDVLAVGAVEEDSRATCVDGDGADNLAGGSGAAYVFVRDGAGWSHEAYVKASNTGPSQSFGGSVAVSNDMLVAGAERERSNATGVNGDQSNESALFSGAAYTYALDAPPAAPVAVDRCSGDGGDQAGCTDCPCSNNAPQGTIGGCLNSAGTSTRLVASGSSSIRCANLRFEASGAPPFISAVLTSGNALAPANMANPCFGMDSGVTSFALDGLRCAVQGVLRHGVRPSGAGGGIGFTTNGWGQPNNFFNFSAFAIGQIKHFQIIHRDDSAAVCMTGQNTSQAVSVGFTP